MEYIKRPPFEKLILLEKLRHETCNFIKKETLTQAIFCEFCEIFKSTFFTERLRTTAFEGCQKG